MCRRHPARVWVGIDADKARHWASAVNDTGAQVWPKKIVDDEAVILAAIGEAFPALERAFDYSTHKGTLILLTGYQTPGALCGRGRAGLAA
ncbi:hypothetical protein FrEUN1fDRAFT_7501 [Parafrankia sp. EUN1f]|nr:hypothetical protein FrEUN1fDRAFT_7501 [Parafrankia sp. EUN1f]